MLGHPAYLSPFAWLPVSWTAFPSSDYYGDSVPMRLAPVRGSRVPHAVDVSRMGQVPVSCPSDGYRPSCHPRSACCRHRAGGLRLPGGTRFHPSFLARALADWTLGFNQSRLHHSIRASTGTPLDGFAASRLLGHAAFPSGFRLQVGPTAQVQGAGRPTSRSVPPMSHGDQPRRIQASVT